MVGAPLLGDVRSAIRIAAAALASTVVALVLLVPWPLALLHADGPSLGLLPRARCRLSDVLRFHTGSSGAGLLPWGLLVAAALPLITATGNRLVWAGRAWLLMAASFALAWLPGRLAPSLPVPVAGGLLVPAALGLVDRRRARCRRVRRGAAHRRVRLAAGRRGRRGVRPARSGARACSATRWAARGDFPGGDWRQSLAWMNQPDGKGAFRVLWIGDPSVLPLDGAVTDGLGYGLSRNGAPDARALWPRPAAARNRGSRRGRPARDRSHRAPRSRARAARRAVHRGHRPRGARRARRPARSRPGLSTTLAGPARSLAAAVGAGAHALRERGVDPDEGDRARPAAGRWLDPTGQALAADLSTARTAFTRSRDGRARLAVRLGGARLALARRQAGRRLARRRRVRLGQRLPARVAPVRVHFAGGPATHARTGVAGAGVARSSARSSSRVVGAGSVAAIPTARRSSPVRPHRGAAPGRLDRPASLVGRPDLRPGRRARREGTQNGTGGGFPSSSCSSGCSPPRSRRATGGYRPTPACARPPSRRRCLRPACGRAPGTARADRSARVRAPTA